MAPMRLSAWLATAMLLAACPSSQPAEPEAPQPTVPAVVVNVAASAKPTADEPVAVTATPAAEPAETDEKPDRKGDLTDEEVAALVKALSEADVAIVGQMGAGGVSNILGAGDIPQGLLDTAADRARRRRNRGAASPGSVKTGGPPPIGPSPPAGAKAAVGKASPQAEVQLGPVTVNGGAVSNAELQVARLRGNFRRCYEAALNQDPSEKGSLVLEIDLGPSGKVEGTRGAVRRGVSHGLQQCVEAVALSGRFSQPGGGSATLAVQLSFAIKP